MHFEPQILSLSLVGLMAVLDYSDVQKLSSCKLSIFTKTFEIFEIHDLYQDVKTSKVSDILRDFLELKPVSRTKLG